MLIQGAKMVLNIPSKLLLGPFSQDIISQHRNQGLGIPSGNAANFPVLNFLNPVRATRIFQGQLNTFQSSQSKPP
jgi:hypothetical protein